jgi:curved DNA-binding protein
MVKDYYSILGVEPAATEAQIRQAFRRLARLHHPDTGAETSRDGRGFHEIREAYEQLSNPLARRKYDASRRYPTPAVAASTTGRGGAEPVDPHWRNFVTPFEKKPIRGGDVSLQIHVSLEEVLNGCSRQLPPKAQGGPSNTGNGKSSGNPVTAQIPPGTRHGQVVRVKGAGKPGLNNGANGDLLLTVLYRRHPRFEVNDANLLHTLALHPVDAVLGGEIQVPTLEGSCTLRLPSGVRHGQKFRLHGRGLPLNSRARADLIYTVNIAVPRDPGPRERQIWQALRQLRNSAEGQVDQSKTSQK